MGESEKCHALFEWSLKGLSIIESTVSGRVREGINDFITTVNILISKNLDGVVGETPFMDDPKLLFRSRSA